MLLLWLFFTFKHYFLLLIHITPTGSQERSIGSRDYRNQFLLRTSCSSVLFRRPRRLSTSVSCLPRSDLSSCLEPSKSSLRHPTSCSSCCRVVFKLTISSFKWQNIKYIGVSLYGLARARITLPFSTWLYGLTKVLVSITRSMILKLVYFEANKV